MKAYRCTVLSLLPDCESAIVMAKSRGQARYFVSLSMKEAGFWHNDWGDVVVKRAPEYDQVKGLTNGCPGESWAKRLKREQERLVAA